MSTLTIEFELRCNDCGYILRGLELDGRCPECGKSIAQIALDALATRLDHDQSTRQLLGLRQLRQLVRGGIYLLVSGAITIVVGLLPSDWFRFKTLSRTIIFCTMCVAAGLSLAGMWNFGGRDRRRHWRWDDLYGWALRGATLGTLAFLLIVTLLADHRHPFSLVTWNPPARIVSELLMWCLPVGGALLYVRIRKVARQLHSPLLAALAGFLVCASSGLMALLVVDGWPWYRYEPSSLELLSAIPAIPAGPMALWEEVPRQLRRSVTDADDVLFWMVVLVCVISMTTIAGLTWRAWRASRAPLTSDDAGRRIEASSVP